MKKIFFTLTLLLATSISSSILAQDNPPATSLSDTFRIQNFPLKIWRGGERIKKLNPLGPTVLSKDDFYIKQYWNNGKTFRQVGLGTQVVGVVLMGLSVAKSANGDESGSSLVLGGATVSLGGMVLQLIGTSKAKKALHRYNGIHTGRFDAIPVVLLPGMDTIQPVPYRNRPTTNTSGKMQTPRLANGSFVVATGTGLPFNIFSSNGGLNTAGFTYTSNDGEKVTNFSLSPNVGYFLNDGLLGGVSLSIASSTAKIDNRKHTTSLIAFGPFIRYYGDLPNNGNKNLKWTAEAAVGFGTAKSKVKIGNNVNENADGLFTLSLGPGLAYFLSDKVSVEVQAAYERLSVKDKESKVEASQGSFGLRFGFGVFL